MALHLPSQKRLKYFFEVSEGEKGGRIEFLQMNEFLQMLGDPSWNNLLLLSKESLYII